MVEREDVAELRARIAELESELRVAREGSETLEGVLAAVPVIVMRIDADYRMLDISRVVSGYRREDVVGTDFFAHTPEAEHGKLRAIFERVLRTGAPEYYETHGPGPDGQKSHYDSYVARTKGADGSTGLVIVVVDVTERIERERALAASEETRLLAVEATGVGLWSHDLRTGVVTWNEAMHRICGTDAPLSFEAYFDTLVHPDDRAPVREEAQKHFVADRFQGAPHRIVRSDGETRWVVTSGRILSEDGEVVRMIGSTLDVTAERLVEERLRQTQRLEAVGQLAAGVAHNFNNILASIVPVLELVQTHVPERYRSIVAGAGQSSRRATELVRQLMTFAGQRAGASRRSERLARVAESAASLCRRVLDRRIELSLEDGSDGVRVRCDAGAIEQAIVNLVLNARDAIDETGRGSGHVRIEVFRDDAAAEAGVRVIDDGIGMSASVARRIFEPFFTTKDVDRGTGLGLAITYATLRDHDGSTTCTSEPGHGSTFELRMPIDASSPAEARASAPHAHEKAPERRQILLVEDDAQVGTAVAFLLRELGHEVSLAASAEAAIELARRTRSVSLVLLDRAMPGEPGDAAIPVLRSLLPGVPIVYFTGEDVDDEARARVEGVLAKPATAAQLAALLRELAPGR